MTLDKFIFWDEDKNYNFEKHCLVLPDISIGNVGQLTVDLLIANLEVEHLGRIVHPCFYPFIGSDPFQLDSTRLSSSCEIYECKEKKLIILQIRSRVFPGKSQEFKDLLMQFFKQFNFLQTVLIASSSSEYFSAEQIRGVPVYYFHTSKVTSKETFTRLQWKEFSFPYDVDTTVVSPIPGSFISEDLLDNCEKENIPLVILICVCSEGNNYPEALQMVNCLNSWLSLKEEKKSGHTWKMPVSWKSPYGSAAPKTMY